MSGVSGDRVIIVGGGIAGMTAAHELLERGYRVTVLERRDIPGGKARSYPAPGTAGPGRPGLPAEHGFRFFPGFYRHMDHTMRRIPFPGNPNGVLDNLVSVQGGYLARMHGPGYPTPVRFPRSMAQWATMTSFPSHLRGQGLTNEELGDIGQALWRILTSSRERRIGELEEQSWWDFLACDGRSALFQQFFASGQIQNAVACKAEDISARTAGVLGLRLMLDVHLPIPGRSGDRVLVGPTSEVFLEPWLRHLRYLGVRWRAGVTVTGLEVSGGRVAAVTAEGPDGPERLEADHYVVAVPIEVAARLLDDRVRALDPGLAHLSELAGQTAWMSGIQFYLDHPVDLVNGHVNCIDTPWALTTISQEQVWPGVDLSLRGDGRVRGIVSVDISAFDAPGLVGGPASGKTARRCCPEEIAGEVWEQLRRSYAAAGVELGDWLSWSLDESLRPTGDPDAPLANEEPLFINVHGSWSRRPEVHGRIPNLVLAGDYVRTFTDLATMEAANESARRAVNVILDRTGYRGTTGRCAVWDPDEAHPGRPLRALDARRFRRGLPWSPPSQALAAEVLELAGRPARRVARSAARRLRPPGRSGDADPQALDAERILARNGAPDPRPFFSAQRWNRLLFAHFRADPEALRARLPPGLELDLYQGQAWMSVIAMSTDQLTIPVAGARRPWRSFPQVNVRTYVRAGDRSGVHFVSVLCAGRLPALGARRLFGMPYVFSSVQAGVSGDQCWLDARMPGGGPALQARYTGLGEPFGASSGSLESFLHERYDALQAGPAGALWVVPTLHDPWRLQRTEAELDAGPLLRALRLPVLGEPPLLYYAHGASALCWAPRREVYA